MANRASRSGRNRSTGGAADRLRRIDEYYREVADRLLEQIEKGTAPWTQAWQPGEKALPANVQTGKAYRGGNSVWLMSVAERRGYADERWGTYRQVRDLDGQVRKGEKGCTAPRCRRASSRGPTRSSTPARSCGPRSAR